MEEKRIRPENGCARCVWWWYKSGDYGECRLLREKMYYKHAPCDEYEKMQVSDVL